MNRLILILSILLTVHFLKAQTKNFIDQPYLETTAKVDTMVAPDLIYLDILIRERDERNKTSVEELEERMIAKLQSIGIDTKKQLTLSDLASNFKKYFLQQKDILKDKAYELKVFDSKTAGRVMVELEEIGISNIELAKVEYSGMDQLKLDLKSRAIEKAKIQAEFLVIPIGQKLGKAIHITDKHYEFMNQNLLLEEVVVTGYGGSSKKQNYEPPSIEFRPIKVEGEVLVKFAIE